MFVKDFLTLLKNTITPDDFHLQILKTQEIVNDHDIGPVEYLAGASHDKV